MVSVLDPNEKLFLATVFEFVYVIVALVFSSTFDSKLNSAAVAHYLRVGCTTWGLSNLHNGVTKSNSQVLHTLLGDIKHSAPVSIDLN